MSIGEEEKESAGEGEDILVSPGEARPCRHGEEEREELKGKEKRTAIPHPLRVRGRELPSFKIDRRSGENKRCVDRGQRVRK